jgi:hypothetical protein
MTARRLTVVLAPGAWVRAHPRAARRWLRGVVARRPGVDLRLSRTLRAVLPGDLLADARTERGGTVVARARRRRAAR